MEKLEKVQSVTNQLTCCKYFFSSKGEIVSFWENYVPLDSHNKHMIL